MNLIKHEKVQVESFKAKWRVVTRSPYSGRCLKVWATGDRAEMELLAKGINRQKESYETTTYSI